jgi:hypothetical protein
VRQRQGVLGSAGAWICDPKENLLDETVEQRKCRDMPTKTKQDFGRLNLRNTDTRVRISYGIGKASISLRPVFVWSVEGCFLSLFALIRP